MNYLKRLAQLDYSRSLATPVDNRVVLLTGQSSFVSSRLTEGQLELLNCVKQAEPIALGFPYHPEFDVNAEEPGIAAASFRNTRQFLWSLRPQLAFARALQPLFSNTRQALYVITGSCGLQILHAAWPLLEVPAGLQLRVVALGPASLRQGVEPRTIQGRADFWSWLLYYGAIDKYCDGGHLDYWNSREVQLLVKNACA